MILMSAMKTLSGFPLLSRGWLLIAGMLASGQLTACLGGNGEGSTSAGQKGDDRASDNDDEGGNGGKDTLKGDTGNGLGGTNGFGSLYASCTSAEDCDDGIECTEDVCEEVTTIGDEIEVSGVCYSYAREGACPVGQFCLEFSGCVDTRACSRDEECEDDDGCTVDEECNSSDGTCRYRLLDADGDLEPPPICGGHDCDDDDWRIRPGEVDECDFEDNDCDGEVDEDVDTQTDPLNCGECWVECESGICEDGECAPCGQLGDPCCWEYACREGACDGQRCVDRTCGDPVEVPDTPVCSASIAVCAQQVCDWEYGCVESTCDPYGDEDGCAACALDGASAICAEQNGCEQQANALRCCYQDNCPDLDMDIASLGCSGCYGAQNEYLQCVDATNCYVREVVRECFPRVEGGEADEQQPGTTPAASQPGVTPDLPTMPSSPASPSGVVPQPAAPDATNPVSGSAALGATCTTDAQCGTGLTCVTPNERILDIGFVPSGLCTKPCTTRSDCLVDGGSHHCLTENGTGYCFEQCPHGTDSETKCHGRADMACSASDVCLPTCRNDADCDGRFCDLSVGFCQDQPSAATGGIGDACVVADTQTCKGYCLGNETSGICTGRCAVGGAACGSSGWPPSGGDAMCMIGQSFHVGDEGVCGIGCFTSADCEDPAMACGILAAAEVAVHGVPGMCWFAESLPEDEILP